MKKLKTCIIGCGNIFPMHAVSVTRCPETELVAVCDVKEDRAKAKAEEFGCKYYLDYKEMIDKEQPDVVHLCLPHYLHPIVAIYCEERGINVLTEKPMSIELKDAKAMIDTAKAHNVTLGCIFQNRYNAGTVLVKDLLDRGELGKIKSAKLAVTWDRSDKYYTSSDWKGTWDKEGGGVIIDQAIHTMDMLRYLVNEEIDFVDATIANRGHAIIDVEDSAEGIIKYKSGLLTAFHAINYYSYDAPVEIEMDCEKALVKKLGEPVESREYRMKIMGEEDFRSYGENVLKAFEQRAAEAGIRAAKPSYEGVRLVFPNGWALLRMSLHDPQMPLNIESRKKGGVAEIAAKVQEFLQGFTSLDMSVFKD